MFFSDLRIPQCTKLCTDGTNCKMSCVMLRLTQHNTRRTPIVKRILGGVRLTQYDMLPHHQVHIRELVAECF
jgi:hypothetical protein